MVEDWCPILGLFSAAVLGPGEGERECVLAIADRRARTGDSNKRREAVVRIHELHGGRWARPWPIFAPSGESDGP